MRRTIRTRRRCLLTTFYVAQHIAARVLLNAGTPADLAEAGQALARLHDLAASVHNTRFLIEVLALDSPARGCAEEVVTRAWRSCSKP